MAEKLTAEQHQGWRDWARVFEEPKPTTVVIGWRFLYPRQPMLDSLLGEGATRILLGID